MTRKLHRKFVVTVAILGGLIIWASFAIGRGTVWVTLFGTDFGYSIRSGSMIVSKAPGGFYHWWAAFAEHDFAPLKFGMGYDPLAYGDCHVQVVPQILTSFGGIVQTMVMPFWIVAVGVLLTTFLIERRQTNAAESAPNDR